MSDTTQTSDGQTATPMPVVQWGVLEVLRPHIPYGRDVPATASGNALSIILPQAHVSLQSEEQPLYAVYTAAFQIPVQAPEDGIFVGYKLDLRGFADTGKGVRTSVFLDLAGTQSLIEFPFGQEYKGDFGRDFFSIQRSDTGADFLEHPLTSALYLTLTLVGQRMTEQDIALISIDTLDITAVFDGRKSTK